MRLLVPALLAASCAARPVSGLMTIPKETPATCADVCANMGLTLGAVVVIANEVGCVCEKAGKEHAAGSAAVAAGIYVALFRANDKREPAWAPGY